jgi:hypothetical protein
LGVSLRMVGNKGMPSKRFIPCRSTISINWYLDIGKKKGSKESLFSFLLPWKIIFF